MPTRILTRAPLPKISRTELYILRKLSDAPRYGQELVDASNGFLSRGTVYTTLNRMEKKGLVSSFKKARPKHQGGLPLKRFRLKPQGRQALERWASALTA